MFTTNNRNNAPLAGRCGYTIGGNPVNERVMASIALATLLAGSGGIDRKAVASFIIIRTWQRQQNIASVKLLTSTPHSIPENDDDMTYSIRDNENKEEATKALFAECIPDIVDPSTSTPENPTRISFPCRLPSPSSIPEGERSPSGWPLCFRTAREPHSFDARVPPPPLYHKLSLENSGSHAGRVISIPQTLLPRRSEPALSSAKKAELYLYSGGMSTVLSGGVMLGPAGPQAPVHNRAHSW